MPGASAIGRAELRLYPSTCPDGATHLAAGVFLPPLPGLGSHSLMVRLPKADALGHHPPTFPCLRSRRNAVHSREKACRAEARYCK